MRLPRVARLAVSGGQGPAATIAPQQLSYTEMEGFASS